MKKKICSILLAVALVLSMAPALTVGAGALTVNPDYNNGNGTGGGGGVLDNTIFSSAVVRNTGATGTAQGSAQSIEVVVTLKNFASKNSVYALVMKASDYSTLAPSGPKTAGIDQTNYFSQKVTAANYAIGRKNPATGTAGGTISLPLVEASSTNDSTLGSGGTVGNKSMPKATVTPADYYDEYVLVVFSTERATDNNYYVDHFYVDADGYVCTPSYLLRYNKNDPEGSGTVTGTPARTIVRAFMGMSLGASSKLSRDVPARNGYTFKGWADTEAKADAGTIDYVAEASYATPANLYQIYDLYAVWEKIPVAFETKEGSKNQTVTEEVRVGVSFTKDFNLDEAVDGRSTKSYTVTEIKVDGDPVTDSTKYPGNIPAGLSIVSLGGNKTWKLSGTPKYDSDKPIVMSVEVTDTANNTIDSMELTIPAIKKGRQLPPDKTVNTGLGSQMADDGNEETLDGQMIGFYSKGQADQKDGTDATMTDGTGTYTDYYLTKGMVYEYRPKTELGDGDWREIPAPKGLYGVLPADWTDFEGSLLAGAATRYKTTISSKTTANYAAVTEGGPWAAWDAAYGAIIFDETSGLPIVTGLAKDAEYEIRFRGNDTFDASPAATIIVGGAAASTGPSGYSVLFNLMGGELVWIDAGNSNPIENPYITITAPDANTTVTIPALPEGTKLTKGTDTFLGFTDGAQDGSEQKPYLQAGDSYTLPGYSIGLAAVWSGRADPSAFAPIVFYDWDGSAILGTIIVDKKTNAAAMVAEFESTAPALREKTGYAYDGVWIKAESKLPTNYDDGAGTVLSDLTIDKVDFTTQNMQELLNGGNSLSVKAAYKATAPLSGQYSFAISSDGTDYDNANNDYGKFGNTTNYSIKLHISRNGARRTREAAVRVIMTTDANVQLYSLTPIDNLDETEVELVANSNIKTVQAFVIDTYGVSNWVGAPALSAGKAVPKGTVSAPGFLIRGTISQINTLLKDYIATGDATDYEAAINTQTATDIGMDTSALTGNAVVKARNLRAYWKAAYEAKGGALNWQELQYAINNQGAYHSFPTSGTNP